MTMPAQKPHKSKQDYRTPPELIAAVERRFGKLTWDLAATRDNSVVPGGYFFAQGSAMDALKTDWMAEFDETDLLWLNPPFGAIATTWAPVASKWCELAPWMRVIMLTPASIGSEWFRRYVHRKAMVLALNPRLHFVGETDPYPKDCMISCFGFGVTGFDLWRWDDKPERSVVKTRPPAKRLRATV